MDINRIKAEVYENFMDSYNAEIQNTLEEYKAEILEVLDDMKHWMAENDSNEIMNSIKIEAMKKAIHVLNDLVSTYSVLIELLSKNRKIDSRIKEEIRKKTEMMTDAYTQEERKEQ